MEEKIKYVYHGSTHTGLKKIKKNKSTHGKYWVYATLSKAISIIFISNKGNDLYYYLSGDGTKNNPVILVERKENMFKDIFNVSGEQNSFDYCRDFSYKVIYSKGNYLSIGCYADRIQTFPFHKKFCS